MTGLRRIINVRPEERALTAVLFLQYFFVVAVAISGNSARDALFLNRYDRSLLPLMLAACAIAVAAAAAVYSRLARRLSPKSLQNTVNLLLLLGLLLLKFRLEGHGIPVLYVWIEMTVAIVTLSFWLAASEVFDPRQAKRLFGPIGGGGALACILVGSAVDPFSKAFGAESLLWLAALGLAAQWALGSWGVRHVFEPRPAAVRPRPQAAGPRFDAYLVSIAAVVALSAVVSQLVDFQFKMFAAEAISSESDLAGFFGRFYAVTGGATLLVQFFLTSTVLTRFGLLAGMLTLPLSLGSSALLVLLQPALFSAGIGKFADQTFKFTLNSSSWELLWLPVPLARRKTIRPLVSGSVKAVAEASAGLVTFFLVGYTGLRYLSLVSLGALAAWIVTAVRLKRLYAKALIFALERRQVDFEGLTLDAQDPAFVRVVERTLESSDEAERLFALELMDGLPLAQWSAALRRCFDEGSPEVRLKVMQLVANEPEVFSEDSILEAVRAEGPVALEAIRAVAARGLTGADPVLRELIGSGPPEVRAAAAAVFLERNTADRELAAGAMKQLLENADRRGQAAALPHLADHPELLPASLLAACLRDPSRLVQEAALKVAALRKEVSVMAEVVACLDDPRNTPYVLEAVRSVPADRAIPHLERSLRAGDTPPATKLGILRILAVFPAGAAAPLLVQTISPDDLELSAQAVRSLLALARNQQIPAECVSGVPKVTDAMLRSTYQLNRMLKLLGSSPVDTVLQSDLADRIRQIVPIVLGLEMISSHNSSLEDAVTIAEDDDPVRLPLLLELLDQVLPPEKRKSIMPLIEALSVDERDSAGIRLYSDLPSQLDRELSKRVYSPREWEAAIVIDHLWRADYAGLLKSVDWGRVQDSRLTREVKAAVANQLKGMYSTLEKAILLKGVSLFADIPMEKLGKIAQFAQETRLPKGSVVVREGEFGDSLFIVADGAVRVHKGSQNLAVLRKGDCVGEMALLDYSPRSADVTVEEDAALFRIEREDFHEVTTTNPEIMQAIVRMLVRRLREADEKLARQPGGTE